MISRYKDFIKENIREDEWSFLNDNIYSDDDPWGDSTYVSKYDDNYDGYEDDEDIDSLLYLLRKMFNNSGIDNVHITNKKLDLKIHVELKSEERLRNIIKVFEVVNKLKKDILVQYDSEFDLWETKKGAPLFIFNFYYDEDYN